MTGDRVTGAGATGQAVERVEVNDHPGVEHQADQADVPRRRLLIEDLPLTDPAVITLVSLAPTLVVGALVWDAGHGRTDTILMLAQHANLFAVAISVWDSVLAALAVGLLAIPLAVKRARVNVWLVVVAMATASGMAPYGLTPVVVAGSGFAWVVLYLRHQLIGRRVAATIGLSVVMLLISVQMVRHADPVNEAVIAVWAWGIAQGCLLLGPFFAPFTERVEVSFGLDFWRGFWRGFRFLWSKEFIESFYDVRQYAETKNSPELRRSRAVTLLAILQIGVALPAVFMFAGLGFEILSEARHNESNGVPWLPREVISDSEGSWNAGQVVAIDETGITWLSRDGQIEFWDVMSVTDRALCVVPPSDVDSLLQHTAAEAASPPSTSGPTSACEKWVDRAPAAER